jgi:hypothetical protein
VVLWLLIQGVNSALEEALVLGQYLQEQEVGQAVESGDENLSLPATDAAAAGAVAAATGAAAEEQQEQLRRMSTRK